MASVNKVILIGNVGRDPETRFSASGSAICNLSVATTRTWKDKEGAKQEETEWHRVVMYGKLAEITDQYVKKGRAIYVEGRLQTRKWTDKEGNDRYSTEVIADQMQMLGGKDEGQEQKPVTKSHSAAKSYAKASGGDSFADMDSDVPF
jgi:single-strand DNA-binding protein